MDEGSDWGGRTWPELTQAERRAHFDRQLNSNIQPFWKRVMLAAIEHGCGWARAIEIVKGESGRINRRGEE